MIIKSNLNEWCFFLFIYFCGGQHSFYLNDDQKRLKVPPTKNCEDACHYESWTEERTFAYVRGLLSQFCLIKTTFLFWAI